MSTQQLAIEPEQGLDPKPSEPARDDSGPVTVIEPQRGWVPINFRELWRYRDLLLLLVRRNFAAQYRQSVFGIGWAFFNPISTLVLNTIIFSKMANFSSDGIPYPVFNFSALLIWGYFAGCLSGTSSSVVGGSALITKVYFPRLILPLTRVVFGLITFSIRFTFLLALMAFYGIFPTWAVVTLPAFILLAAISALSVGLWVTAIDVKYRDIRRFLSPLTRFWMFATPVVYSIQMVPEQWRPLYSLNPMVSVVEGFRWALLGKAPPDWTLMAISTSVTAVLFVGGLYFFRRAEATFADVI